MSPDPAGAVHRPTVLFLRALHVVAMTTLVLAPLAAALHLAHPAISVIAAGIAAAVLAERWARRGLAWTGLAASGVASAVCLAGRLGVPGLPTLPGPTLVVLGWGTLALAAQLAGRTRVGEIGGFVVIAASVASALTHLLPANGSAPPPPYALPLPDALVSAALGTALVTTYPRKGVYAMVSARSVVGSALRVALLIAVLFPFLVGLPMLVAQREGWLDPVTGTVLMMTGLSLGAVTILPAIALRAQEAERAAAALRVALETSRQQYRALLDARPNDAAFLLDASGIISAWSSAGDRVLGLDESAVLGRPLSVLYPLESQRSGDPERDLDGARTHERFVSEGPRRRQDGTVLRASSTLTALRDRDGKVSGYVGSIVDVTGVREAEERSRREAAAAAEVRADAEATRRRSRFLTTISHEIRTPVWAMVGIADLLAEGIPGPLTPLQAELLQDITKTGGHLTRLIHGVLDLAHADSGHLEFHPTLIDPAAVVIECIGSLGPAAAKSGITVHAETNLTGPVRIDSTRFRQVVYNFLSNAVKFTPRGGKVTVRTVMGVPGTFRLEVQDTGPGIAPADTTRLFVEFQQLNPDPAAQGKGSGLGLALVRRIVELQGGRVGMHPPPGGGSVFFAVLPVAPVHRAPPGFDPAPDQVLVVDDDRVTIHLLTARLQRLGLRVLASATGEAALDAAATSRFRAAVVDLILPDMSGIDLVRSLRTRPGQANLGVLLVTDVGGLSTETVPEVQEVLRKPLDLRDLDDAFRRLGLAAHLPQDPSP